LSQKAATLAPYDDLIVNQAEQLGQKVHELCKERERQQDFLRTAPERWPRLDYYKRQLLSTLIMIQGFEDWKHLSVLSGIGEQYLKGP
jgi:hypothetical protein